ncbi:hypothetical protein XarjCFBP7653_19175 [Xanthomonas arboricola]|nr:hypothetical protein XarjCFBP7653_19175 [Xanthomonas arboricola]
MVIGCRCNQPQVIGGWARYAQAEDGLAGGPSSGWQKRSAVRSWQHAARKRFDLACKQSIARA